MSHGYRATRRGVVPLACPDWPLDWHELFVLARGFASDDACHLARAIDPDWEWKALPVVFASQQLFTLQGANWQRSGGQGKKPTLLTAAGLRGDSGLTSKSGVKSGRRKGVGAGVGVKSSADFVRVKEALAARRRASKPVTAD